MPSQVMIGQTWQIMVNAHRSAHVVVKAIGKTTVTVEALRTGRAFSVALGHFEHGKRGLRLLKEADGTEVSTGPSVEYMPLVSPEERRTASELRKVTAPRGLARATDADREILRLKAAGVPTAELARRFKVTLSAIHRKIARVREAEIDARNAADLARSG